MSPFALEDKVEVTKTYYLCGPSGEVLDIIEPGPVGIVKDPDGGEVDAYIYFPDYRPQFDDTRRREYGAWIPWSHLSPRSILDQIVEALDGSGAGA